MPNEMLKYADTDTPLPSSEWQRLSDSERRSRVEGVLRDNPVFNSAVVMVEANKDGGIIVQLAEPMPASRRGTMLLDLEEFLKKAIDGGLVVWLEPLGDRNSLRNLRGVEVKS